MMTQAKVHRPSWWYKSITSVGVLGVRAVEDIFLAEDDFFLWQLFSAVGVLLLINATVGLLHDFCLTGVNIAHAEAGRRLVAEFEDLFEALKQLGV